MIKAKVGDHLVPIELNFKWVLEILPADYDLHLTKAFTNQEKANEMLVRLLLDDELIVSLCLAFGKDSTLTSEDLMKLTSEGLEDFRQKFWEAYVAFSPPLRREMMIATWNEAKILIKSQGKDSNS